MSASISKYMQIPYRFNGRGFDGADCYGLLVLWFKTELGIDIFDPGAIFQTHRDAAKKAVFVTHPRLDDWIKVEEPDIERHDVLLLKKDKTYPTHCGIVLNQKEFLHLEEEPGCTIGKLSKWRPRVYRFYRYKVAA